MLPLLLLLISANLALAEDAKPDKSAAEKKQVAKDSGDDCCCEKEAKPEANKDATKPAPAPASGKK